MSMDVCNKLPMYDALCNGIEWLQIHSGKWRRRKGSVEQL